MKACEGGGARKLQLRLWRICTFRSNCVTLLILYFVKETGFVCAVLLLSTPRSRIRAFFNFSSSFFFSRDTILDDSYSTLVD